LRKSIEKKLDEYLPKGTKEPKALHRAMRYSVFSGGKRLRPIITLEACRICSALRCPKNAVAAACAVELIHTYSLIHDDLPSMDNDDYRRGKPTCHKIFGEASAILAGDALLPLAFSIVTKEFAAETASKIVRELSDAIGSSGMVGGQVLDLEGVRKKNNRKILNRINYLKTARLFEAAAKIGAMAATTDNEKINAMAGYGINLGMAFQIADDIADKGPYVKLFGPEKTFRDAGMFIKRAKQHLNIFGKKAENLLKIADSIIQKK